MDFYKIKADLEKKLKIDPSNNDNIIQYSCALMETGDFKEALSVLQKAAENKPNIQILNNLAYIYLHEGNLVDGNWVNADDEAIKAVEQIIKLNPVSSFPYSLLGSAYLNKGRYVEAQNILEKAISIRATVANYNNLGITLYMQKRYQEALEQFLMAHKLRNEVDYSFQPYLSYGICLATLGRKTEAEEVGEYLLNSAEVRSNGNVELMDIVKVYFFNENYVKAAELFPVVFEEYTVSPSEFGMYVFTLVQLKMLNEADNFYKETIKYNNECIDDTRNDSEIDEYNKEERIKFLKSEIEQFGAAYYQIKKGIKPSFMFEPQVEEECYLFGCIRHNNPNY